MCLICKKFCYVVLCFSQWKAADATQLMDSKLKCVFELGAGDKTAPSTQVGSVNYPISVHGYWKIVALSSMCSIR